MSERLSEERLAEIRKVWEHLDSNTAGALLLAEVDRIRALLKPDPGEEKELAAIRGHIDLSSWRATNVRRLPSDREARWSDMMFYLTERLASAHGILTDWMSDNDHLRQQGAAEERARCIAEAQSVGYDTFASYLLESLPALPPLAPPAAARARADALEVVLRHILEAEDVESVSMMEKAIAEARALLEGK